MLIIENWNVHETAVGQEENVHELDENVHETAVGLEGESSKSSRIRNKRFGS